MYADVELIQRHQLDGLLDHGYTSAYGRKHGFRANWNYRQFADAVPVASYESLQPYIEQAKAGRKDQLWEGKTDRFAISSGTTGTGKYLPITEERLQSDRNFLKQIAWRAFKMLKSPKIMAGKHLSLPGSLEQETIANHRSWAGEISGHLAQIAPKWLGWFQTIPAEELVHKSFESKFNEVLKSSQNDDIRLITAVPSWILRLFQEVIKKNEITTVKELWPNLELLICGGVALRNYAGSLNQLYGSQLRMIETYGASEGYFAHGEYTNSGSLDLVIDNGVFYEWQPLSNSGRDENSEPIIPTWEVETGQNYKMIVSTNAGLWRYPVGDIIEFSSLNPQKIKVVGRVEEMLDDYGEALYLFEAEQALEHLAEQLNFNLQHYSVSALHEDADDIPRHFWFLGTDNISTNPAHLATMLDRYLRDVNRHYAIRRQSGALGKPVVNFIPTDHLSTIQPKNTRAQSKPQKIITSKRKTRKLLEQFGEH